MLELEEFVQQVKMALLFRQYTKTKLPHVSSEILERLSSIIEWLWTLPFYLKMERLNQEYVHFRLTIFFSL